MPAFLSKEHPSKSFLSGRYDHSVNLCFFLRGRCLSLLARSPPAPWFFLRLCMLLRLLSGLSPPVCRLFCDLAFGTRYDIENEINYRVDPDGPAGASPQKAHFSNTSLSWRGTLLSNPL